jgi:hypothetical protein
LPANRIQTCAISSSVARASVFWTVRAVSKHSRKAPIPLGGRLAVWHHKTAYALTQNRV